VRLWLCAEVWRLAGPCAGLSEGKNERSAETHCKTAVIPKHIHIHIHTLAVPSPLSTYSTYSIHIRTSS
jgi:hypothetical protein